MSDEGRTQVWFRDEYQAFLNALKNLPVKYQTEKGFNKFAQDAVWEKLERDNVSKITEKALKSLPTKR